MGLGCMVIMGCVDDGVWVCGDHGGVVWMLMVRCGCVLMVGCVCVLMTGGVVC